MRPHASPALHETVRADAAPALPPKIFPLPSTCLALRNLFSPSKLQMRACVHSFSACSCFGTFSACALLQCQPCMRPCARMQHQPCRPRPCARMERQPCRPRFSPFPRLALRNLFSPSKLQIRAAAAHALRAGVRAGCCSTSPACCVRVQASTSPAWGHALSCPRPHAH